MSPRIPPLAASYPEFAQKRLDRLMPPDIPPLILFTTLATDQRLFERFMDSGLLDRGNLTMRQREIVIDRVTAQCGCEYEWGVHIAIFTGRVGLTPAQIASLARGRADDACWEATEEQLLLEICDRLKTEASLNDALWRAAREVFTAPAMIEILMLAGFYRAVSYLANGLALPLEPWAARFDQYPG